MSQPSQVPQVSHLRRTIPQFEGLPVSRSAMRITGLKVLEGDENPVCTVDDRVRLIGEFKVIEVRHIVDKNGEVVRVQVLVPIALDTCPWDPNDPSDDGVARAR